MSACHRSPAAGPAAGPDDRFLSEVACRAVFQRLTGMMTGGGETAVELESSWTATLRWARNRIMAGTDVRTTQLTLGRTLGGTMFYASGAFLTLNTLDDAALAFAMQRAERYTRMLPEQPGSQYGAEYTEMPLTPTIWSDATYHLAAEARAELACTTIATVQQAGLVAAGFLQLEGHGRAVLDTQGRALYYPSTAAQFTVTVRDPEWTGSGWAGVSHWDWGKIDPVALTQTAIEKCLAARHPVALEPGRYTTILEPQAVAHLVSGIWGGNGANERPYFEHPSPPYGIFQRQPGKSRLGEVVMDPRLIVETDPMDPELATVPFFYNAVQRRLEVYHAARWIDHGVLTNLPYDLAYAMEYLGKNTGLPSSGAFRMRSAVPPMSLEEMVATTQRGLWVTRLEGWSGKGSTRDGVWLVENGKRTKAVKNLTYEDDPFSLLQPERLEQIGAPVRVHSPGVAIVVPALKVKDFNFLQLVDSL